MPDNNCKSELCHQNDCSCDCGNCIEDTVADTCMCTCHITAFVEPIEK